MLKWLITVIVALALMGALTPLLARLGLGRLPGDVRLQREGREYYFPFSSTILLSLLLTLLVFLFT
jgi:hypothetical protein